MRDARAGAAGAAGILAHLLLAAGWMSGGSPDARVALAFAALVLVPGFALLRLAAGPPGGPVLAVGWALGCGVAWQAALVLATRALGLPFTVLAGWSVVGSVVLWALALRFGAQRAPGRPGLGAGASVAVLLAAAVALVVVGHLGPPLSYYTDSPDHLGTIRRMMSSGDAFPRDAFFRDAGPAGADPRKGLWHPIVALVAILARVEPQDAWRVLSGLLASTFVLNAAAFGALVGGGAAAAVGAWALLVTYGGSIAEPALREAVFSTKLADQLALATAAAVLADLEEPGARRRAAAVLLGLGAVATHVFASVQFTLTFAGLGVGLLVRDRRAALARGAPLRRLVVTAGALALASLPYLLWRVGQSYAPRNVIHTEPQGLLWIADSLRVVSPGVLWGWMGTLWILFPLAWVPLARRARERPALLYLLTTSLGVALVLFCPPVVALLEPRLGYLLMRFVWMVPLSGLLAWLLPELTRALRRRAGAARLAALGLLALTLGLLAVPLRDLVTFAPRPRRMTALDAVSDVRRWSPEMDWLDRHLPPGRVVLSDPATSYAVPMMTRHYVVTLVDQHSSPNDAHALQRILDARDALDPWSSWARTREVIGRYGVDVVVLNGRFAEVPHLDYWTPRAEWFAAARARLDRAAAAFQPLLDEGNFVVYRVHRAALDRLDDPPPPRAFVRPWEPARDGPGRGAPGVPGLVHLALSRRHAAPGDTLAAVAEWHAAAPQPAGSYLVAVRFDRALPAGPLVAAPLWLGKPARKLEEALRRERFRFRSDHLPAGGDYGVDLWRPREVVRDSFSVVVPGGSAPGDYQVRVRMLRQPHYPNYRLSDYFFDEDYYAGVPAGHLRVLPASGARGAP